MTIEERITAIEDTISRLLGILDTLTMLVGELVDERAACIEADRPAHFSQEIAPGKTRPDLFVAKKDR